MGKSEDYLDEFLNEIDEPLDTEIDFDENLFDEELLDTDLSEDELLESDFQDEDLEDLDLSDEDLEDLDLPDLDLEDLDLSDEELFGKGSLDEDLQEEFPDDSKLQEESILENYTDNFETALQEVTEKNALHDKVDETFVDEVFDNLDSIVSGKSTATEVEEVDFKVEDFSYDDIGTDSLSLLQGEEEAAPEILSEIAQKTVSEPQMDDAEADVMKILEGLGDIDLELETDAPAAQNEESKVDEDALLDFLTSSAMMDTSDSVSDTPITAEAGEEASVDNKKKKSAKKEQKGFFGKLGELLFGEDEEENSVSDNGTKGTATSRNDGNGTLNLFQDVSGESSASKEETEVKEKKKKKDKKEKVKKEKKPKPKKEKKPKPPKEPDNTPPLPKKPVMLILVMVASVVVLIVVGTNLLSYKNAMNNAKDAFAKKNYTEAYSYVSGMKIKEKDIPLFDKYETMALISSEYEAYKNLMDAKFYDMAFDSLIRMVGRCDKYKEDAMNYGCINELNFLEEEAEKILNKTFNMTIKEAIELYNYRDRRDYSNALNAILKEIGLEKVIEE